LIKKSKNICKCAIAGDGGIRKTSLMIRLKTGKFCPDYKMVPGEKVSNRSIN
jgi:GTPase SAR1 family protein